MAARMGCALEIHGDKEIRRNIWLPARATPQKYMETKRQMEIAGRLRGLRGYGDSYFRTPFESPS
ncbi:MAG: hypothetical protein D6765_05080, partial [Bacteroidetes bacterium]